MTIDSCVEAIQSVVYVWNETPTTHPFTLTRLIQICMQLSML